MKKYISSTLIACIFCFIIGFGTACSCNQVEVKEIYFDIDVLICRDSPRSSAVRLDKGEKGTPDTALRRGVRLVHQGQGESFCDALAQGLHYCRHDDVLDMGHQ